MDITGLENLQLAVTDIDQTRNFYGEFLGLTELNYMHEHRLAVFEVGDFVLRFKERESFERGARTPVDFIGLELSSFEAVDAAYDEALEHFPAQQIRDVRNEYADHPGPYGFYIHDPDGYRLKLYRYNDG